jgi:hypothetical protein
MAKRRELKVYIQRRGGQDRDAEVERCVRSVVAELFSTRMANTLRITVKLRATKLGKGVCGEANWHKVANVKSKQYAIVVDRDLPSAALRSTIVHELRHVEQYATGRLRHGSLGGEAGRFWRPGPGRAQFFPYATTDYWTSPWEVEARETQKSLKRLTTSA